MTYNVSVILCTHNPRKDYLHRVLDSLRLQTLADENWELLIIDNKSDVKISKRIDVSWKKNTRIIVEENLGLTHARIRGIKESKGELIIFVDDDNLLSISYLEKALQISKAYTSIGVYGGNSEGEFEITPPDWIKPFLPYLAIKEVKKNYWANTISAREAEPCGAGICLRRDVALSYINKVENKTGKLLGRKGGDLMSGEDTDMVLTALDKGYGMGMFKDLHLIHIIPKERLTMEYMLKLVEGLRYSHLLLSLSRNEEQRVEKRGRLWRIKHLVRQLYYDDLDKRFYLANVKAETRYRKFKAGQ